MESKKVLLERTKNKFLSGIINENEYERLLMQIAADFQDGLKYEEEQKEAFLMESKERFTKMAGAKPGSMHDILDIPKEEKISSKYSSGAKLAKELMDRVGDEKKVSGMLAFAANINKEDDIFDRALRYMKHINESHNSTVYNKLIEEGDFFL